tara:strand:+ start:777 stop:950 length:174 start_codon:yes stop_codon:yes gene_type:complete
MRSTNKNLINSDKYQIFEGTLTRFEIYPPRADPIIADKNVYLMYFTFLLISSDAKKP